MRSHRKRRRVRRRRRRLSDRAFAFLLFGALAILAGCGAWYYLTLPYVPDDSTADQ